MNKLIKGSLLLATAALVSNVYAGGMTAEPMQQAPNPTLFTTLEGGYTWNQFGNTTVNGVTASQSNSGASGRLAVGATHYSTMVNNLSYTAELGGGYYGQTDYTRASSGINAQNYVYGLDLLAGVDYQIGNMFDVFFKAGGMIQDVRMDRNTDLSKFVAGGSVTGIDNETTTASYFAPEIKLGGVYDFTNLWGLSLSYLHVFGNNVNMNISKTDTGGTVASNTTITGSPVSLNNLMVGLRYKFN